jgi:hypothetical protein
MTPLEEWTVTFPSLLQTTGTCGQEPMVPLIAHPPFFITLIFFPCTQHFATFYVSLYDIYTIKTIEQ